MMENKITATVKGTVKWNNDKPFEESVDFTLFKAKENDYGTGLYMAIDHHNGVTATWDCRYAKTRDIRKLAQMYIEDFYGVNLQEFAFN